MAYAVLVSLFNSTHKMLSPGPYRIIPCNKVTIQSLHQNIDSLISFLENAPPHQYQTTKSLEANIIDVGYKAEDILESYITKHSRSIYKIRKTVESEVVDTDRDDKIDENYENIDALISFLGNTPPHKYQTTKPLEANIRKDIFESYIPKHFRSIYKIRKTLESEGDDVSDAYDIEDDGTDEVDFNDANDSEYDSADGNDYSKYEAYEVVETDDGEDENDENRVIMLSESLVEVIKGFESLMEQMKEIQSYVNFGSVKVEQMASLSVAASSDNTTSSAKNKFVLLNEEFMNQIKEQLFFGDQKLLKVIPLVGMGGIGKTTLAKALIEDSFTLSHFDVRGWVTVSQQYSIQDVVKNLLKDIKVDLKRKMGDNEAAADLINAEHDVPKHHIESRQQLHQTLYGRRYVVVLDDLWDTKACDELLRLFPDWNNGSRIIVTTRQSRVATFAAESYHEMKLLNGDTSWDLLRQVVFGTKEGNNSCPPELTEIGKEIAKKCSGLPLTISVIGGLLSKEKIATLQHWEQFSENMKSTLTEEGDQCLEILSLSFNHLPHHLKACFLYFGIFPEDQLIDVSDILQLWAAEAFLKAYPTNYMENVAEDYLQELIERNLILVHKVHEYNGKPEFIKIHDLLRDLCIREAGKEKFLYVLKRQMDFNGEEARGHRRLSILLSNKKRELGFMIQSMPGIRSLICFDYNINKETHTFDCDLLRVIHMPYNRVLEGELSNLRYLAAITLSVNLMIFKMWDLQYIILFSRNQSDLLPQCIWYMPQLRNVLIGGAKLPPLPPKTERPMCVLERLESLSLIQDFRCDDEVLIRIPNLRELWIAYDYKDQSLDWSYYRLDNLVKMTKLETLRINALIETLSCVFTVDGSEDTLLANLAFPLSLKKLTLISCKISREQMDIIGFLPNLQMLELRMDSFVGQTWETSENHFEKLEYLSIDGSDDLQEWIVEDANHFPSLRYLRLRLCYKLEEIPTSIGEIPTLETIELGGYCSEGVYSSAKNIQDEINIDLKLIIDGITRHAYEEEQERANL